MSAEQNELDLKRLHDIAKQLGEHFDTVQIFATRHESGEHDGTLRFHVGVGNWYARFGQVAYWLQIQNQDARNEAKPTEEPNG